MRTYLLVVTGGVIGASLRWSVAEFISRPPAGFPWATLFVNLAGCALIGLAARSLGRNPERWAFAVTGVLGGFTTFSTFAVETRQLVDIGESATALAYVAATVVGCLAATEIARGTAP